MNNNKLNKDDIEKLKKILKERGADYYLLKIGMCIILVSPFLINLIGIIILQVSKLLLFWVTILVLFIMNMRFVSKARF